MQELHGQEVDEYIREREHIVRIYCDLRTVRVGHFDIREKNIPFCFKHTKEKGVVCEQCGFADYCNEVVK